MSNRKPAYRLPSITLLSLILEIGFIIVLIVGFATWMLNTSSQLRVRGDEFSYLAGTGAIASDVFKLTGKIPLWNPFMGTGEPLLEHPFSYVLNPFMFLPVLLQGPVQGTKTAIFLHVLLAGLGGWVLARVLCLRWPGRVLLGGLMAANGSMIGAIGAGFYQMSLSQAYLPWIFAGLIATLRTNRRWAVGLLTVASIMLIFAGIFWYVLPTVITAVVITLFFIFRWNPEEKRLDIDVPALQRLAVALVLTASLSAIRMLPQLNGANANHPIEGLGDVNGFWEMFGLYFAPSTNPNLQTEQFYFHYIVPAALALLVSGMRLGMSVIRRKQKPILPGEWRIIGAACIAIVIFTIWSQGGIPIVQWFYRTFPFLYQWRSPGRIAASAGPWVAVVIAIWFDDILLALRPVISNGLTLPGRLRTVRLPGIPVVARLASIGLLVFGLLAVVDVLGYWNSAAGAESNQSLDEVSLTYLREQHPTEFLSVLSGGFWAYFPFYETLTRAAFGNPDYRSQGIRTSLGKESQMQFMPTYAVGTSGDNLNYFRDKGYEPVAGAPHIGDIIGLWHNATVPAYAFWVSRTTLDTTDAPLTASNTTSAAAYQHHIDSVDVSLDSYRPGSVLVIQEIAYPGWAVTIDNQAARMESVGGLLGVVLPDRPDNAAPTHITFTYQPKLLYWGAGISLIGLFAFAVVMLRVDQLIPVSVRARVRSRTTSLAQQAIHVLTSTEILRPQDEDDPLSPPSASWLSPAELAEQAEKTELGEPEKVHDISTPGD